MTEELLAYAVIWLIGCTIVAWIASSQGTEPGDVVQRVAAAVSPARVRGRHPDRSEEVSRHLWRAVVYAGLAVAVVAMARTYAGVDAAIYHSVPWPPDYSASTVTAETFNYSPAFAFWVQPLRALPWEVFYGGVLALSIGSLVYMVGAPLALLLIVLRAPLVYEELTYGNLNLVVGALVLMGLRYGWAWAPMLLTKVTPGVGLVWFVARREWRMVAVALGVTLVVALPALILAPQSWVEWAGALTGNVQPAEGRFPAAPLWLRWPLAAGIVWWGARTDRVWTVPLAVIVATPVNYLGWVAGLGVVRLLVPKDRKVDDGLAHQRVVNHPVPLRR